MIIFFFFFLVVISFLVDIVFIFVMSVRVNELYDYMFDVIKFIVDDYGMYIVYYVFMVFGDDIDVWICFGDVFNSFDWFKVVLENILRIGG